MSITSEELNYLIYRYLQESGRELTALCLQEETRVLEFEDKFQKHIPVGYLVSLLQKGILYTEAEMMVDFDGTVKNSEESVERYEKHFTLAQALNIQSKKCPSVKQKGRFALENDNEGEEQDKGLEEYLTNESKSSNDSQDEISQNSDDLKEEHKQVDQAEGDVEMDLGTAVSTKNDTTLVSQSISSNTETQEEQLDSVYSLSSDYTYSNSTYCDFSNESALAFSEKTSTSGVTKIIRYLEGLKKFSDTDITLQHIPKSDNVDMSLEARLVGANSTDSCVVTCLAWSQNADRIMTGIESGELRIWMADGTLNNVLNLHKSPIIAIKWSPDGVYCLSMDINNVVIVWNTFSGTPVQHFDLKKMLNNYQHFEEKSESLGVDCCWVDTDKFVIPGLNGAILLFEVDTTGSITNIQSTNPAGRLIGHSRTITCVEYDQQSKMLLSSSDDCTVRVWKGNSSNFRNLFVGHTQPIVNAAWFHSSEYIISSSIDGTAKVWSILPEFKNKQLATSIIDGTPIVYGCISNDKSMYAIGRSDGKVVIFNLIKLGEKLDKIDKDSIMLAENSQDLEIPIKAEYDLPEQNKNNQIYISCMSWKKDDTMLAVSYDQGQSHVLKI